MSRDTTQRDGGNFLAGKFRKHALSNFSKVVLQTAFWSIIFESFQIITRSVENVQPYSHALIHAADAMMLERATHTADAALRKDRNHKIPAAADISYEAKDDYVTAVTTGDCSQKLLCIMCVTCGCSNDPLCSASSACCLCWILCVHHLHAPSCRWSHPLIAHSPPRDLRRFLTGRPVVQLAASQPCVTNNKSLRATSFAAARLAAVLDGQADGAAAMDVFQLPLPARRLARRLALPLRRHCVRVQHRLHLHQKHCTHRKSFHVFEFSLVCGIAVPGRLQRREAAQSAC